jgi:hypothetical protein
MKGRGMTDLEKLNAQTGGTAAGVGRARPVAGTAGATEWHITPVGGPRPHGWWRPRRRTVAVTLIGGADLDLTEVEIDALPITITKVSLIEGVRLRVPPAMAVKVSGFSLFAGHQIEPPSNGGASAPLVRPRSFGIIGGAHVSR